MNLTQKRVNKLAYHIVGCAIEVHKHLGPGLLESIYEQCMVEELERTGCKVNSQVPIPLRYKGIKLDSNLKLDLLVNDLIIVELKAVTTVLPVFQAQLLSYLKLARKPKGLLINFHCENIVSELVPLVNDHFAILPEE